MSYFVLFLRILSECQVSSLTSYVSFLAAQEVVVPHKTADDDEEENPKPDQNNDVAAQSAKPEESTSKWQVWSDFSGAVILHSKGVSNVVTYIE